MSNVRPEIEYADAPFVRFPVWFAAEFAHSLTTQASRGLPASRQPLGRRSALPAVGRSASFGAGCPRFAGQRTVGAHLKTSWRISTLVALGVTAAKSQGSEGSQHFLSSLVVLPLVKS
jgi:hypothetical protein